MKKLIIALGILSLTYCGSLKAQDTLSKLENFHLLDTIYANDKKNVTLFFPHPIRQGITGSENFVFTYNRDKEQYFGLLQAKPGEDSNLLVINNNGAIYSYIISYKKQISKLNYFISRTQSIGNVRRTDSLFPITPEKKRVQKNEDYTEFCSFLLRKKRGIGKIKARSQGIVLSIENIVFHRSELYFVIKLENRSTMDYDINFLNLSILTRQKGKRKSTQILLQEPIFKHKLPAKVKQGEIAEFIFVFPKFSISKDRRLIFELNEENGERNIALKLSHRLINSPN